MAISLSRNLRLRSLHLSNTMQNAVKATPPFFLYALTVSDASTLSPSASPPIATIATAAAEARAPSSTRTEVKQRGTLSKMLLFLPGFITFGLGSWQLIRRQDKIKMMDYRRKRLEMDPVTCDALPSSYHESGSSEFRRVICEGDFDESRSVYIGPRSRSISGVTENGYYVITPLHARPSETGGPVLVNRGWIPRDWRNKQLEYSQNSDALSNSVQAITHKNHGNTSWKFWSKKPEVTTVT